MDIVDEIHDAQENVTDQMRIDYLEMQLRNKDTQISTLQAIADDIKAEYKFVASGDIEINNSPFNRSVSIGITDIEQLIIWDKYDGKEIAIYIKEINDDSNAKDN